MTTSIPMIKRSALHFSLLIMICALPCESLWAADPIAAPKAQFEAHAQRIDLEARTARKETLLRYSNMLSQVTAGYQEEGHLEALLEAKADRDAFLETGEVPLKLRDGSPDRIRKAHSGYLAAVAKVDSTQRGSIMRLGDDYIGYLNGLKRRLTASGNLDEALAVRDEIKRVKTSSAYSAAQFESAAAKDTQRVGDRPVVAPDAAPDVADALTNFGFALGTRRVDTKNVVDLKVQGAARVHELGMVCRGGRIVLNHSADTIRNTFRKTNAITIEVLLTPASDSQSGPARIVSSSQDGYARNFSLCQEKGKLVLRLRTTETGLNGTNPEVSLGAFAAKKQTHVIISYSPNRLICHVNGKPVAPNVVLGGDFSNWEAYPLVFGNEYKVDRPWLGSLRMVNISAKAISVKDAYKRYDAATRRNTVKFGSGRLDGLGGKSKLSGPRRLKR
ncbi:MAG: hypothetical protein OSB41_12550 [Kiritimatiellae bacterium]|nr:hypothetical protein [Kiritimatiellia bacterium]